MFLLYVVGTSTNFVAAISVLTVFPVTPLAQATIVLYVTFDLVTVTPYDAIITCSLLPVANLLKKLSPELVLTPMPILVIPVVVLLGIAA